jgi:hypothetical protein
MHITQMVDLTACADDFAHDPGDQSLFIPHVGCKSKDNTPALFEFELKPFQFGRNLCAQALWDHKAHS